MTAVEWDTSAFERGLRDAVVDLRRDAEAEAVRTAEQVRDRARTLAPKVTGRLANSIEVRQERGGAEISVGVDYGAAVEFGARRRPPKPYLRPALAEAAQEFGRGMRR